MIMQANGKNGNKVGAVLVVGGGIGGLQAALDFAAAGIKAYVAESAPCVGGYMAKLDKTFPTNDCAMCTMAPRLVEIARHKDIELITLSEVDELAGKAGDFSVVLRQKPRYVDESLCTGCGVCVRVCPLGKLKPSSDPAKRQPIPDEHNEGLASRGAIHIPYPQAVPNVAVIDPAHCIHLKTGKCSLCQKACQAGAIDFKQQERKLTLKVGAVVLTPGYELFDPRLKPEYGYGRFPNVVRSIEFERLLSASGPFEGRILRPSDKTEPKRIAFIQCVGSRDCERDYCSAICCMYATKEALLAKEHLGAEAQCDIFFMDLRAFSKGFEEYYLRAKSQGISYIRCRPPAVTEGKQPGSLGITYVTEDEKKASAEYDLVVLCVGLRPARATERLAATFGLSLNQYGFCQTDHFRSVDSPRAGVFVAGTFSEPKDIPETVIQASAGVARSLEILAEVKGELIAPREYPPERQVAGEEPRVGVFVCHCGTNIAAVVDVANVVADARTLGNVVHAQNLLYACARDSQEKIAQAIQEQRLNRVVVAACTPRTHEGLFRNTLRASGLNPYLFEMANIRDQCSWVHPDSPELASRKARNLLHMAVAKARLLEPLQRQRVAINKDVLVIGGGLSGLTAALSLADQGYAVHLVERQPELGGNLRRKRYLLESAADPKKYLARLIERVKAEERIKLYLLARISAVEGCVGNFTTRLSVADKAEVEIRHGAIVVATGVVESKPTEYLYGENAKVLTQSELEELLGSESGSRNVPRTVVMIQCVGCRDKARPYCSRTCCSTAIKNALKLKELNPAANVYVLYRDIRTYGFRESYYTEARRQGVVFIRYDEERKPVVEAGRSGAGLSVRCFDPITQTTIALDVDWLVLSAATVPQPDSKELAQQLKVPLDQNGFFLEAHMKLRPVDCSTDGIFLAGGAHFPKTIAEAIAQAQAASGRVATVLSGDTLELEANISQVVDENCDGCAYCLDPCPYKALTLIEYKRQGAIKKTVERNASICKGCGVCMATCPKKGIYVSGFKLEQISAMVDAALLGDAA